MSQMLRPPSVGPIVGHTTDTTARLWMRGADADDRRTVGVAALFRDGRAVPGTSRYFRLHREYDRTGTIDFTDLPAGTPHVARMGSIITDSSDPDVLVDDQEVYARLPSSEVWTADLALLGADVSEATFTTSPARAEGFSFLLGSCRYPGILVLKKRSDEIFSAMWDVLRSSEGPGAPRFLLMVGDQIYADKYTRGIPLGLADTEQEFHERYLEAFGSPYLRRVMRTLPTYMILDDHEIEDNWVQGRLRAEDKRRLFNHAIHAYLSYQWLHGPRNFGKKLYYSFDHGGHPFFVLDQRTQRVRDDHDHDLSDNHLLGWPAKESAPGFQGQVDVFCDWLVAMQKARGNAPKFVVSASVFVPNCVDTRGAGEAWRSDSWPAFPETRRRILSTLVDQGVQNVVFLCGDIHCSNVAEMSFESRTRGTLPLKAFCITSSAFYWPFPFADGDPLSFVHDSKTEQDGFAIDPDVTMHYRAWAFEQNDNFTRVTFDAADHALVVENFGRKSAPLGPPSVLLLAALEIR